MENINNFTNQLFTNQLNEICQFGNSFNLSNKYVGLLSTEFKTSGDTLENIIDNIAHTYARTRKINIDLDSKLNLENLFNIIENGVKLTLYTKFGLNYRDIINKFDYTNELTTAAKEELIVCINEGYKRIFTKMEKVIINEVEKAPKIKRNYTKAEIAEARSINLVDYLLSKGENIKRVGSKGEYTLQDHDSMRINENKFVWNSQGINGNAVDFCMRYYNMTFTEAVGDLLSFNGHIKIDEYVTPNAQKTVATNNQAKLLEPEPIINPIPYDLDAKTNRAYSYLTKTRLIDKEIVQKLIAEERIAQDIKGNLIFKIYDKDNQLSGAEITGTLTDKRYKQVTERNGNGFVLNLNASDKPTTAMFFESAIDLLSFYSLHKNTTALLVSMAGLKDKVIEKTVKEYGLNYANCYISSDNDEAGEKFAKKIIEKYGLKSFRVNNDKSFVKDEEIKDWNDLLKFQKSFSNEQNKEIVDIAQKSKVGQTSETSQLSQYDFINHLSQGDLIKYDNYLWNIVSINDDNIVINNLQVQDYMLPIVDWKEEFKQEYDKNNLSYISSNYTDKVVLYKSNGFFESYGKDAEKVSKALNLVLGQRTIDNDSIKMVGIQEHSLEIALQNLSNNAIGVKIDSYDNFLKQYNKRSKSENITAKNLGNYDSSENITIDDFSKQVRNDIKITDEDVKSILLNGTGFVDGKKRVYNAYNILGDSEIVNFLKKEYGDGGSSVSFADGSKGFQMHDAKGIHISKYYDNGFEEAVKLTLSWNRVKILIKELINEGIYYNGDKLNQSKILNDVKFSINYTENSILQKYNLKNVSLALGSKILDYINSQVKNIREYGYDKTDFTISGTINNEEFNYSGRYDIGSEQSTLINHIESYLVSELENKYSSEERIKEINDLLKSSIPYLKEEELTTLSTTEIKTYSEFQSEVDALGLIEEKEKTNEENTNIENRNSLENTTQVEPNARNLTTTHINKHHTIYLEEENVVSDLSVVNKTDDVILDTVSNYHINNDNLGQGKLKEKFARNIKAINLLKTIESENRLATKDEQEILSNYVGWGGLSDAFDERKDTWVSEYTELKSLLTPSEYSAAAASTLNAHYTSPIIIKEMYQVLKNLGFDKGKILEPAMGIGNFFGMLPENMRKSKLYGVELDNISGRIAQQLYPEANIQIKGFEKTAFQSNFFDVIIGNVPFGNYRINDNDFKNNDLIHDFFFKKSLDKVRPGGVIAFITSKGTLDKQDNTVRKYLAERAELLGAIRLPNNAFKANAGTEVTSDIIFLQKRDKVLNFNDDMPDWVNLDKDNNGILLNKYFINHNEMILGNMTEINGRFGMETACLPIEGANLAEQLHSAIANIKGTITQDYVKEIEEDNSISTSINAENYRNYCYAIINNEVYYRENDNMIRQDLTLKKSNRIKGMVKISTVLQDLISAQTNDLSDSVIKTLQDKLNTAYDNFVAEFGILSDKNNKSAFVDDDTAALLLSLENLDKDGKLESKADIFTKRTIKPYKPVEYTETASEALAISISEKGRVDLEYMSSLCGKGKTEIIKELQGVIFKNPITNSFENADEYLSGNVREKLKIAKEYAQIDSIYLPNVKALENVQPEDLKPEDISVQLGSTWVPNKYYDQFIYYLLDTPTRCRSSNLTQYSGNPFNIGRTGNSEIIMTDYDEYTARYAISNKISWDADRTNIKATTTYGTERMNAYKIIEETLNMKNVCVYDYIENEKGNKKAVLNNKETLLAQEKQDLIKRKFKEWIFDDYDRTKELCKIYNDKFNSIRLREYDGSHIIFPGMNPEIRLRKHQVDAIAHTLYGGNTLLAHAVGAGKSYEMIASAMESKRLGLCNKSMIVVPKPIVKQMAKEFLQLYPAANILVPSENDFTAANRQRFCSRIATGNYDAIIISHNQLESIPLSEERQRNFIESEINEITDFLQKSKLSNDNRKGFTVKQLEATKKALETKLEKLSSSKHDRTITFEELGVDKIYVDEAHNFKNKFFATKMSNVAGISTSTAQKSEDLYMKCRYLDEKTNYKGIVFATGTPISNSMVELYTMQTYLQYDSLKNMGLHNFDAWASTFGETQIGLELSPEGKGYRLKTRFNKFNNLTELMNMFKSVADIKTADMLNLPVPTANYHTIATEASEYQKDMIDKLAERAEAIRNGSVDRHIDNMPMITNDGKKIALDQRLINPLLPDDPNSKVNVCIDNIFKIWQDTTDSRSTQLLFCDFSTPNKNKFNVYDDVKEKLIQKGIPEKEIAFIHDYNSAAKKIELFNKMKAGDIRVLIGSTSKLGTGTNCQNKLKAVHHLDCPYKPSDLEQRNGRIIRQGNENKEVDIYTYVTKNTFDAYLYQLVENKQKFISQIMTSKSFARVSDDVDECVLNYAEVKAIASGDPRIKEKIDLEIEVNKLRTSFAAYQENKRKLQRAITEVFPNKIQSLKQSIEMMKVDAEIATKTQTSDFSSMEINGVKFTDKKEAGTAFLNCCKNVTPQKGCNIGNYRGFDMNLNFDASRATFQLTLKGAKEYYTDIGNDVFGNITRIDNTINGITKNLINTKKSLEKTEEQFVAAKLEVNNTFLKLPELREKESRLNKLNNELSIDDNTGINKNTERKEEIKEKSHRGIHH